MIEAFASLIVNLVIAVLLVAVIFYCRKLNRSIKILQSSKNDMAKLFAEFDESIEQAAESVHDLQEATRKAEGTLKDKLDKANLVADDLTFMIERGIKLADQLERGSKAPSGISAGNPAAKPMQSPRPTPQSAPPRPQESSNKLGPLAGKSMSREEANNNKQTANSKARTASSIESVLEQMANRNNPKNAGNAPADNKKASSRIRSKAEQELFDSLKSGR